MDIGKLVRSAYRHLDLTSLLRQPTDALLGVSADAKEVLKDQHIVTVLDLAASALFREAAMLVAAADDPNSEWALAGNAPRTVVDNDIVELPVEIVADREVEDLRAFSQTAASRIMTALSVSTIRELAAWPPYLAARQIFQRLVGQPDSQGAWDAGTPAELVPTMGRHPTERVYYQTILLDRFLDPAAGLPTAASHVRRLSAGIETLAHAMSVPLESAGQVDIADTLLRSPGFDRVAVGALVQFSQSWFTSGLSLGQLLHSLALAPGESTRIAMIDWQRRERGDRAEGTQETDQLTSELSHNRALNEVVTAVAREVQSGSSASQVSGESFGFGKSGGGGGSYGGNSQSYGFGGGYSLGYGSGKSQSSSWGVSTGNRDLRSELSQNIQDLTHQASTMTRNRWATVVQEVSQQESEELSTRAVTNYNHMHALTIQYYEVVQIYRVAIDIERITRCLFVPMKIFDFRRYEVITRFRGIIAAGALNAQIRATLLAAANSVVLIPARRSQPWNQGNLDLLKALFGQTVGFPDSAEITFPRNIQPWGLMVGMTGDNTNTQEFPFDSAVIEFEGGPALTVPITELGPTESSDLGRKYIDFRQVFGTSENAKDFWNIRAISFKRKAGKEAFAGEIFVTMSIYPYGTTGGATQGRGSLPLILRVQANEMLVPILAIMRTITDSSLAQHLEENALYYSQFIWRSLDPTELSLVLAAYTIAGQPLMQVIDPTPVTVAGNYMIFRTYATDASWQAFLDSKSLSAGPVSSTVVPLPTGGVFAEAVLGRANSAEKLDMTRFWNWQDSPIPITAPEIAALQAGSRNQSMDLETGKLSPSVLNIMNPTTLPDPTGMAAALAALAQGAMFRDMSGLAETIGLTGTGLQEAYRGSSDAQKYAMENFKTAASLITKGAGGKSSTVSEDGARINQGRDMDNRGASGLNAGSLGGASGGAAGSVGAGGQGSGGGAGGGADASGGNEQRAFESALGGGTGGLLGQLQQMLLGAAPGKAAKTISVGPRDPGWRACCALGQWKLGGSGALDPTSLGGHRKGGLSPGGPTGYVYSKYVGLVDLGHVRDLADLTKFIYDGLVSGGTVFELSEGTATVFRLPIDTESLLALAGAMAYVESWAHELATWPDESSFSPEDLCSNIIGIECAKRAIRSGGGSYDAAMDVVLNVLINSELNAATKTETEAVLAKIDEDTASAGTGWFEATRIPPSLSLLRRNFDGMPWMAGMPFDSPLSVSWLSPASFEPLFFEFSYAMTSAVAGKSGVTLSSMKATTASLRSTFLAANPGKDRPA